MRPMKGLQKSVSEHIHIYGPIGVKADDNHNHLDKTII